MEARGYVIVVLVLATALCGAVIAFNARVDPYGLAAIPDRTNVAPDAPRPGAFFRKVLTVRQAMPRTIVLGTSRAEFGIDPGAPGFTAEYSPVLNVALGGLSIEQMRLMLIHVNSVSPLRLAVIGLDLESFLDAGRTDFDPAALEGNTQSEPPLLVRLRLHMSREALAASLASSVSTTLGPARATAGPPAAPTAARPSARNWRITDRALRLWEGQHGLIWVAEYDNFYSRMGLFFPDEATAARWDADPQRRAAMASFRQLLHYARSHGIELRMFISPVHARYLEWYREVGWWPLYEAWKRGLVDSVDAVVQEGPQQPAIALWDFGGFHAISTESVPAVGDHRTHMRWYRDTSHYSPDVGDIIVARILGGGVAAPVPLPESPMTKATIDADLARARDDEMRFRRHARDEVADIEHILAYMRRVAKR